MSKLEILKDMVEKHTGVESEADNQTEALIELLLAELGGNGGSGGSDGVVIEISETDDGIVANIPFAEAYTLTNKQLRDAITVADYGGVCVAAHKANSRSIGEYIAIDMMFISVSSDGTYYIDHKYYGWCDFWLKELTEDNA